MKEFCCGDVVPGCTAVFRRETEQEILVEVAKHARDAHGLTDVPPALVQQVISKIRTQD